MSRLPSSHRALCASLPLAVLSLFVLSACVRPAELPVTLEFRNVRRIGPEGVAAVRAGAESSRAEAGGGESAGGAERGGAADEWARIWPVVRKHHLAPNRLGLEAAYQAGEEAYDEIAGVGVRDYRARIVVGRFASLDALRRELGSLRGQPLAPGRRLQVSLADVTLGFTGNFISARRTEFVEGRSLPRAAIYLFDRGPERPRRVVADASGAWRAPVETRPGQRTIAGYSVPPGSRNRSATRRYFMIDLRTNVGEDISQERFERLLERR